MAQQQQGGGGRGGDRFENYVPVAERLEKFYERFPDGRVMTSIVEHDQAEGFVLMRAEVYRTPDDAVPAATGHAFEVRGEGYVNKSSYIENAETSAVGRALALLGFEVRRGLASREEMEKVARLQPERAGAQPAPRAIQTEKPAAAESTTAPLAAAARPSPRAVEDDAAELDARILQAADALGYDAAKVRKWVNQKYEVTGGLDSLTAQNKREVLKIFREKAQAAGA